MTERLPRFQALALSQQAQIERRFDADVIRHWQHLVGAPGPDSEVPEPLIAGLFSCLLGEQLPGHGTNYLKQSLHFAAAARAGEALQAQVTITRLRPDKALVNLATQCTGEDGRLICHGEALVLFQH
jgi:acyl dehydratase